MTSLFRALERADAEHRLVERVNSPALPVAVPAVTPPPVGPSTEYEKLAVGLMVESGRRPLKEVAFVSALRGEGVSTVTAGVAAALALSAPHGVLLVEAHAGEPSLAEHLGVEPRWGLDDVLAGRVPWQTAVVPTRIQGLSLLARVPRRRDDDSAKRLERLDDLRRELRSTFDFCLVDNGSIEQTPTSIAVAAGADGVLVVVEAGRTSAAKVRQAVQMMLRTPATVLGIVLNRRREYLPGFVRHRLE